MALVSGRTGAVREHARGRWQLAGCVVPARHRRACAVKHAVATPRPCFGEEFDGGEAAAGIGAAALEALLGRAIAFPQWFQVPYKQPIPAEEIESDPFLKLDTLHT